MDGRLAAAVVGEGMRLRFNKPSAAAQFKIILS
jgi:hypothetical protein